MEGLRKRFEIDLKAKVSQKATTVQGEEMLLVRNFKHFDTDNDGAITLNEWYKAIEKIGVILSKEELKQLFMMYDVDNDGRVNYKEAANMIYNDKPSVYTSFVIS